MKTKTLPTAAGLMSNGTPTRLEGTGDAGQPAAGTSAPHRFRSGRARKNLADTLAGVPTFRVLGRAIHVADLAATLGAKGPFTMFAPTDKAFARLPAAELDALLADAQRLARVLSHWVVAGIVAAPKASAPRRVKSIGGTTLEIAAKDGGFRVNGATVVNGELTASNGVIHAIDTVLMPR